MVVFLSIFGATVILAQENCENRVCAWLDAESGIVYVKNATPYPAYAVSASVDTLMPGEVLRYVVADDPIACADGTTYDVGILVGWQTDPNDPNVGIAEDLTFHLTCKAAANSYQENLNNSVSAPQIPAIPTDVCVLIARVNVNIREAATTRSAKVGKFGPGQYPTVIALPAGTG